jgi:hypothetical protein
MHKHTEVVGLDTAARVIRHGVCALGFKEELFDCASPVCFVYEMAFGDLTDRGETPRASDSQMTDQRAEPGAAGPTSAPEIRIGAGEVGGARRSEIG